jgi:hypothetical protein
MRWTLGATAQRRHRLGVMEEEGAAEEVEGNTGRGGGDALA